MGDPTQAFGAVSGVTVTPDGTIWVLDRQAAAIRRFAADGTYAGQVGRAGEGPGEFRYPRSIRLCPDGSVAVWDDGALRVSRFDTGGTFLDSFRAGTGVIGGSAVEEFEVDSAGNFYVIGAEVPERLTGRPWRRFWFKMSDKGEVLDTIPLLPLELDGIVDPVRTFSAPSPRGYLVTARNDRYAVDLHVDEHRTVRISRRWKPVPYQRAERREKERLASVTARRTGRPPGTIPEHKPPFGGIRIDAEGRIWVEMYTPGYEEPETPGEEARREEACAFFAASEAECSEGVGRWRMPLVYEVIEPSGRYLGRVAFPNRQTGLAFARGRHVWVVETGTFGEEYVVRYRTVGAGARGRTPKG